MDNNEQNQRLQKLIHLIESWDKNNIDLAVELLKSDADLAASIKQRYLPFLQLFGLTQLQQLYVIPSKLNTYFLNRRTHFDSVQLQIVESIPIKSLYLVDASKKLEEVVYRLKKMQELTIARSPDLNTLSEDVLNWQQLERLQINKTSLASLPDNLGRLQNLQELRLSKNSLNSLPDSLAGLSQLRKLIIEQNQTIVLPDSLGQLKQLQYLSIYVWGNAAVHFPDAIPQLNGLESLYLSCPQTEQLPSFIQHLSKLKSLNCSRCQLRSLPVWISQLKNLEILNLSHNPLQILPESIQQLPKLKEIHLVRTKISHYNQVVLQGKNQIQDFFTFFFKKNRS